MMADDVVYKVNDKLTHPKRPEWGLGVVQRVISDSKILVHFSHVGMKTIAHRVVKLKREGDEAVIPVGNTIFLNLKPRVVKQPVAPSLFDDELEVEYKRGLEQEFVRGFLADDWAGEFGEVYDEADRAHALNKLGRTRENFWVWLGALAVFRRYGGRVVLPGFGRVKSEKWGVVRAALSLQENIEWKGCVEAEVEGDLPDLLVYDLQEGVRWVFLRGPGQKVSKGRQRVAARLRKAGMLTVLLSVKGEARQDNRAEMAKYGLEKGAARWKTSARPGV